MAELTYRKLTTDQAQAALKDVPGWKIEDGALTRSFPFENFADGVVFAGAVAYLAERLNHHPDILIVYRRVDLTLSTHDSAGLTAYDFELAKRVNELAGS